MAIQDGFPTFLTALLDD